jgi:hypothetical protein
MRASAVIALLVACCRIGAAQPTEILKGTHVLLRMVNSISTRTAEEGDFVYLTTASPIAGKGRILVPTGAYVQGVVASVKRSGRVSGRAEMAIRLDTLTLPDGRVVKFTPKLSSVDPGEAAEKTKGKEGGIEAGSSVEQDVRRIAIIAGSGAAIGGIADQSWQGAGIGAGIGAGVGIATALLTRGKEVELRQGAALDVVFERAVTLEP